MCQVFTIEQCSGSRTLFLPARSHPSCFKFSGYERIVPPLSGATLLHHWATNGLRRKVAEPEVFDLPWPRAGLPLRLIRTSRTGSKCFINLVVAQRQASTMFGGRKQCCKRTPIVSLGAATVYNPELGPLCYSSCPETWLHPNTDAPFLVSRHPMPTCIPLYIPPGKGIMPMPVAEHNRGGDVSIL